MRHSKCLSSPALCTTIQGW